MKPKENIYEPPKHIYYFFVITFSFVLFLILMIKEICFTTITLSCFEIVIILALIELYKSNMIINDSDIIIHGWFKNKIIKLSNIKEVKMEDHELYIRLSNDKNLDLPFWFQNKKSLYMVLKSRIKGL